MKTQIVRAALAMCLAVTFAGQAHAQTYPRCLYTTCVYIFYQSGTGIFLSYGDIDNDYYDWQENVNAHIKVTNDGIDTAVFTENDRSFLMLGAKMGSPTVVQTQVMTTLGDFGNNVQWNEEQALSPFSGNRPFGLKTRGDGLLMASVMDDNKHLYTYQYECPLGGECHWKSLLDPIQVTNSRGQMLAQLTYTDPSNYFLAGVLKKSSEKGVKFRLVTGGTMDPYKKNWSIKTGRGASMAYFLGENEWVGISYTNNSGKAIVRTASHLAADSNLWRSSTTVANSVEGYPVMTEYKDKFVLLALTDGTNIYLYKGELNGSYEFDATLLKTLTPNTPPEYLSVAVYDYTELQ